MTTPAERFAALTPKEQERLRLLNEKLWAAEEWIRQRHARSLEWYYGAGGLRRHGDALFEDVETEVAVQCIQRTDHPGWKEDDDNIVATLLLPSACIGEGPPGATGTNTSTGKATPCRANTTAGFSMTFATMSWATTGTRSWALEKFGRM